MGRTNNLLSWIILYMASTSYSLLTAGGRKISRGPRGNATGLRRARESEASNTDRDGATRLVVLAAPLAAVDDSTVGGGACEGDENFPCINQPCSRWLASASHIDSSPAPVFSVGVDGVTDKTSFGNFGGI